MLSSSAKSALVVAETNGVITATALHLNLPLITADHQIRAAGIQTIW
jgi:PIN domain nuclease of toxin-antitoxin system